MAEQFDLHIDEEMAGASFAVSRHAAGIPGGVDGPAVDPGAPSIGILRFGIGAFHRSHQALFTEDTASATGDTRWRVRNNGVARHAVFLGFRWRSAEGRSLNHGQEMVCGRRIRIIHSE